MSKSIKLSDDTYNKLEKLSQESGYNHQELVNIAIEEFERRISFNKLIKEHPKLKKIKNDTEWGKKIQNNKE